MSGLGACEVKVGTPIDFDRFSKADRLQVRVGHESGDAATEDPRGKIERVLG